jgi:hypothetical protein
MTGESRHARWEIAPQVHTAQTFVEEEKGGPTRVPIDLAEVEPIAGDFCEFVVYAHLELEDESRPRLFKTSGRLS